MVFYVNFVHISNAKLGTYVVTCMVSDDRRLRLIRSQEANLYDQVLCDPVIPLHHDDVKERLKSNHFIPVLWSLVRGASACLNATRDVIYHTDADQVTKDSHGG